MIELTVIGGFGHLQAPRSSIELTKYKIKAVSVRAALMFLLSVRILF